MIIHRSFSPEAGRPKQLVLLDVDGTIIEDRPNEFTGAAFDHMYEHNLFRPGSEAEIEHILALKEQYAYSDDLATRRLYFDPLNKVFDRQIAGRPKAQVDHIADEVVEARLEQAFPAVLDEIATWQDYGYYIGYISGSPNFLIQALKRATGADIATGTRFYSSGGGIYHPTRGTSPRGRNKHTIAESMLIDLSAQRLRGLGRGVVNTGHRANLAQFDLADQFSLRRAYGDTIHDESMMRMADEAVAVNPKPELLDIAVRENWRIINDTAPQATKGDD